jgi:acyl-CoA thioesterase
VTQLEIALVLDRYDLRAPSMRFVVWLERWRGVDNVRVLAAQDGSDVLVVSKSLQLERDEATQLWRVPRATKGDDA